MVVPAVAVVDRANEFGGGGGGRAIEQSKTGWVAVNNFDSGGCTVSRNAISATNSRGVLDTGSLKIYHTIIITLLWSLRYNQK